ncbi:MAG TPA: PAS domain S-box protein [Vicinamibacterales bacterium]|nr:PAS domain S-box protein [Vicinamibacterales bacterium]
MTQHLAHVTVLVREYDEALAFFCGTLGFRLVEDTPQPAQQKRWVVVAPPGPSGPSLVLARASTPEQASRIGNQTGGRVFLFLATDDCVRDHARLSEAGVHFVRQPRVEPWGTVAVFADLYGNLWDLIQSSSPPGVPVDAAPADALTADERYRALFERSRDAIYLHDLEGRFLDANAAALELLGYSPGEIRGLRFTDLLTTDHDLAHAVASVQELVSTGTDRALSEYCVRTKDGRLVWVEVLGSLVGRAGGPTAVQGIARDVTARKLAEAELEATRTLLEKTFASLAEGVFVIDTTTRTIVECNAAAERIFGYGEGELIGMNTRQLYASDADYHEFAERAQPVLADRGVYRGEYQMRRRDGTVFATEHTITVMREELGWGHGVVSVVRDITARRQTERDLRLQSAALTAAANAIVITDRHGTIEWVNPAFTASSGYTLDEAVGRKPGELSQSGLHDEAFYQALWTTILAGGVWRGEMANRHKDGHIVHEELTVTPVLDDRGNAAHFVAIKRDLTEVKRLQAQVLQAQRLETVGRLAGGIAHDFNNLLTIINATVDLASAEPNLPGRLGADLRAIRDAGERAAGLTRQLLAFSRKQILQPADLRLGSLVAGLEQMLRRLIGEDLEFTVGPLSDGGCVRADAGQIEQVILNLVVIARDAMPDGGRLTIETCNVDLDADDAARHGLRRPGPYVMLAITDTGVGMDEATRSRIFEPFYTTKEPGKGTGLGLSTVYGIVEQSGGSVWVTSEVGRGTTFKIHLPCSDAAAPPAPARPREIPMGTETLLLVEDEPAVRLLGQRLLERAGYRVLTAADVPSAIVILDAPDQRIDLLLTDVILPGPSGRALADHVKTTRPDLRVLFTSGYTDDAILRHGVLDREVAFLAKPYTVRELTAKVREVLDS